MAGTLIGSAEGGSAFGAWAAAHGISGALEASFAAGFNALVIQAGMQVVGNGGDIGAALKALASVDTVRMLATTMLTAGLTHGLMESAGLGGDSNLLSQAKDMDQTLKILTEELQRTAIRGGVAAGVDTAINGGDLGQNLLYQTRAAGVAVLGKQGARAIGTAFKDQQIDTATKYIAHAALGGTMDLALGGDGTSGALGAVAGELIADTYVNAWIGDKLADPNSMKELEGEALKAELKKLEGEIAELRRKGVDIARLGAGVAAALTGGDINVAAQTGGNAAENNALPLLLIIYGACEAVDAGIKLYNAYKLAEAIQNQDEAAIPQYGGEIVADSIIGAAPLSGVFTKLGMTKVGLMIASLGTKIGDDVASVAAKLGEKYGDNVWTSAGSTGIDNALGHWGKHASDFPNFKTLDDYVDATHDFLKNSPEGTLSLTRKNGDVVKYDPNSNVFAIMDKNGTPRTMYKPDVSKHKFDNNLEYFYDQANR